MTPMSGGEGRNAVQVREAVVRSKISLMDQVSSARQQIDRLKAQNEQLKAAQMQKAALLERKNNLLSQAQSNGEEDKEGNQRLNVQIMAIDAEMAACESTIGQVEDQLRQTRSELARGQQSIAGEVARVEQTRAQADRQIHSRTQAKSGFDQLSRAGQYVGLSSGRTAAAASKAAGKQESATLFLKDVCAVADCLMRIGQGMMEAIRQALRDSGRADAMDMERTSLTPEQEKIVREMEANGEIEIPEEVPRMAEPQKKEPHLPVSAGHFLGVRGNSDFRPRSSIALKRMKEFGRDTVPYKDGNPDFSAFTAHSSPWGIINASVEIGHMTDQRENPRWEYGRRPPRTGHDPNYDLGNFAQADNRLLEQLKGGHRGITVEDIVAFRKSRHLTWHECADGKTMQLVPEEIHSACPHSGGVSEMKYRMEWGDIQRPSF